MFCINRYQERLFYSLYQLLEVWCLGKEKAHHLKKLTKTLLIRCCLQLCGDISDMGLSNLKISSEKQALIL